MPGLNCEDKKSASSPGFFASPLGSNGWRRGSFQWRACPWDESLASFRRTREKFKALVRETEDLYAAVPTGKALQTYLGAILLVSDHNSHHLGQGVHSPLDG